MSRHGWTLGDRAVVTTRLGGHTHHAFGTVEHCTPTTIRVAFCRARELAASGDGSFASSTDTCTFGEPSGRVDTYRWLPSMEEMGQRMDGSLCSTSVRHFDPDARYESVAYY
jgi:hypothetical protein